MKILFISFYFEPDLCAGSFRNSALYKELIKILKAEDELEIITTHPNRYHSYQVKADDFEKPLDNVTIRRIKIPSHKSGIKGQIKSFSRFYFETLKLTKSKDYDLVYASSSRLFTAFLGAKMARKTKAKLYLDIRDIFRETITDIYHNPLLRFCLNALLIPIEKYTFKRADHINIVSEGFKPYFKKYKTKYTYFTNGIDPIFLEQESVPRSINTDKKTILYAGNIGDSQGLDIILPKAAEALKNSFEFIVIGDGGARMKLESNIQSKDIKNILLLSPVNRNELIEYYKNADYLFLHLNKHKAFERVLPSKLFEYGAFDKPMIAGVSGYAQKFLKENVINVIIFEPGNVDEFVDKIKALPYENIERTEFKERFSRQQINQKMAKSILEI